MAVMESPSNELETWTATPLFKQCASDLEWRTLLIFWAVTMQAACKSSLKTQMLQINWQ